MPQLVPDNGSAPTTDGSVKLLLTLSSPIRADQSFNIQRFNGLLGRNLLPSPTADPLVYEINDQFRSMSRLNPVPMQITYFVNLSGNNVNSETKTRSVTLTSPGAVDTSPLTVRLTLTPTASDVTVTCLPLNGGDLSRFSTLRNITVSVGTIPQLPPNYAQEYTYLYSTPINAQGASLNIISLTEGITNYGRVNSPQILFTPPSSWPAAVTEIYFRAYDNTLDQDIVPLVTLPLPALTRTNLVWDIVFDMTGPSPVGVATQYVAPAPAVFSDFTVSPPSSRVAPATFEFTNTGNATGVTLEMYSLINSITGATSSTGENFTPDGTPITIFEGFQGTYDVVQNLTRNILNPLELTKVGFVIVTEPTYVVDPLYYDIFRDEYNDTVGTTAQDHIPNVTNAAFSLTYPPAIILNGNGYIRYSGADNYYGFNLLFSHIGQRVATAFNYRMSLSFTSLYLSPASVNLFSAFMCGATVNGNEVSFVASLVKYRNVVSLQCEFNDEFGNITTANLVTDIETTQDGKIYNCQMTIDKNGIIFIVNGLQLTLPVNATVFGADLNRVRLFRIRPEMYLNRLVVQEKGTAAV